MNKTWVLLGVVAVGFGIFELVADQVPLGVVLIVGGIMGVFLGIRGPAAMPTPPAGSWRATAPLWQRIALLGSIVGLIAGGAVFIAAGNIAPSLLVFAAVTLTTAAIVGLDQRKQRPN